MNNLEEARKVNSFAVTKAIPFDELMTAVDVAENKVCSGQYSKASFSKGELHFEVQDHWIRTTPTVSVKSSPKIERHKIKWTLPDLEIEYRYLDIRLKEFITLNKPVPVIFSHKLDKGSYLQSNPDGSISMRSKDRTEILTIEKPFATDSKGEKFELQYRIVGDSLELTGDLSQAVYPIVIDPTYTVKTGTASSSTAHSHKRSLARMSNGDLWCVYDRSDGTTQQIYCAYSTDGGQTWTEEQVTNQTGANNQSHASIAIDANDNVHVAWHGKGWGTNTGIDNIQYRMRTTSWQTQEAVTDKTTVQRYPAIAIDSDDHVHMVWHGQGWGTNTSNENIQYRERTTSWQTQEAVTDKDYDQYEAAIAIDSADNVHVTWYGKGWGTNTGYLNMQYRKRTTSWQTQEAVTDKSDHQSDPSIAIDSSDNIHVSWIGKGWGTNTGNSNVQYRMRTDSWQTQEAVTDKNDNQWDTSIAIDANDNVHVAWHGMGWGTNTGIDNIQYRKRTTSWQTQVGITDRAYDNRYPILIWALHPTVSTCKTNRPKTGYALVWSGQDVSGYKVEYFCSDDLSWEAAVVLGSKSANMAAKLVAAGVI